MKTFRVTKTKEQIKEQKVREENSLVELQEFFSMLAKANGEPIYIKDEDTVEAIESIVESNDFQDILSTEDCVLDALDAQEELEKTTDIDKPVSESLIDKTVKTIKKAAVKESVFELPTGAHVEADVKHLQARVQDLQNWMSKIAMAGPGSGEVNFRYLDDVARSTMNPGNDNWVLEYDSTTKKVQFTENIGPIRTIKLNTTGPQQALVPGQMAWNPVEDCLDVQQSDGTILQAGLEHYFQIHNTTGTTLTHGEVVMFSGVDEEFQENPIINVTRYSADSAAIPLYIIGVITMDVADNNIGRATVFGRVRDVNTTGSTVGETWSKGDLLWAHPTQAGKMTKVRPTAPDVATYIAVVLKVGATDGVLSVRPTIWPRLFYGDWYDTTNQVAAAINTAYPVRVNSAGSVSGFTVIDGHTIKAMNSGRYNFEFSLQVTSSNSASSRVYIWYRKNGVDVPHSTTVLTISANGGKLAPAWNFPVLMATNDTFTLMWATDATSVSLSAEPATAFCPSIPSVILTVAQTNL